MNDMEAASALTAIVCVSFDHRADIRGLREFKKCLKTCPNVFTSIEVSGTFDLILKVCLENFAAYHTAVGRLAPQIGTYVARYETSFVYSIQDKSIKADEKKCLWVKSEDGHRRIDHHQIDRITAERDYVRIFSQGWACLHHSTIREMLSRLDPTLFVQLHRSTIVRRDFIERFTHEGRAWRAHLQDGTIQQISKPHVPEILRMIWGDESSKPKADPSKEGSVIDFRSAATEKRLHEIE